MRSELMVTHRAKPIKRTGGRAAAAVRGREPKGRRTSESAACLTVTPARPVAPPRRPVQEQQKEERKSESTASAAAAAAADHSGPVAVAVAALPSSPPSTPADVGAVLGCGGGAAWTIGRWALPLRLRLRLLGDVEVEFMDRFAVRTEVRRPPLLSS